MEVLAAGILSSCWAKGAGMPEKVEEFQRVENDSGDRDRDSGNVTTDSGATPEIGHDQTE